MKKLLWIFVIAFLFRFILSFVVSHPDINNHVDWGIRFWQYGPVKFYAPESNVWSYTWPNQPPGTIYMFAGIRKLYEAIFAGFWWINVNVPAFPSGIITFFETNLYPALLKLPAILADLGIAYLIYLTINHLAINHSKKTGVIGALLFLFNPVVWYNSSVWGQTDAVVNFFGLLAFFFLLERKLLLAILSLTLSLYIKASLLIFVPIFLIVAWKQNYKVKEIGIALLVSLAVIGILTLPFSLGEPYGWLMGIYKDKVFSQQLQVITANAFNLWAGIAGIHERPQTLFLGPLTYQVWGLLLFTLSYIPLLYLVFKKHDAKSIFWALTIASFSSFMLLTNMHERYLYPLFPYLTILVAAGSIDLLIYWLVSFISLVNLYNFWWVPKIDIVVDALSAGDRFAPRLLGFLNFGIFIYLYGRFLRLLGKAKI